jgi:hypothetical protein
MRPRIFERVKRRSKVAQSFAEWDVGEACCNFLSDPKICSVVPDTRDYGATFRLTWNSPIRGKVLLLNEA